jgi:hypothetical protein
VGGGHSLRAAARHAGPQLWPGTSAGAYAIPMKGVCATAALPGHACRMALHKRPLPAVAAVPAGCTAMARLGMQPGCCAWPVQPNTCGFDAVPSQLYCGLTALQSLTSLTHYTHICTL